MAHLSKEPRERCSKVDCVQNQYFVKLYICTVTTSYSSFQLTGFLFYWPKTIRFYVIMHYPSVCLNITLKIAGWITLRLQIYIYIYIGVVIVCFKLKNFGFNLKFLLNMPVKF